MSRLQDLTNQKFGLLTVVERSLNSGNHTSWLCRCDCGQIKNVQARLLTSGNTKSCGCYNRTSKLLDFGESSKSYVYNSYKQRCKRRGIYFDLSRDQAIELFSGVCVYCGASPGKLSRSRYNNGDFEWNGIDRIDSNIGYVDGNCVTSCWDCNRAKGELSADDFKNWIKRAYEHNFVNNKIQKEEN